MVLYLMGEYHEIGDVERVDAAGDLASIYILEG
jgi:hypothetical protein